MATAIASVSIVEAVISEEQKVKEAQHKAHIEMSANAKLAMDKRRALAPTGKIWITNLTRANMAKYYPSDKLWCSIEIVIPAIGSDAQEIEDAFAFYGVRR